MMSVSSPAVCWAVSCSILQLQTSGLGANEADMLWTWRRKGRGERGGRGGGGGGYDRKMRVSRVIEVVVEKEGERGVCLFVGWLVA